MTEPMAPPLPPFPVAPPPKSSSTMKWVLGCGLGCLVLAIVVAIAIAAFGYFAFQKGVPIAIQAGYQQIKNEGKVPAEHQATYDRIVQLGTGSGASMSAWGLVGSLIPTIADGVVSEEDISAAKDALALLEANPDISGAQLQEFQAKHPQTVGAGPGAFGIPTAPPAEPKVETPTETTETPAAPPAEESAPVTPPAEGTAPAPPAGQ